MYFAIFVTDKPGMQQARADTVHEFQAWMDDHPDHPGVTVLLGGPTMADDGETMNGGLQVIEAPSLEAARAFDADSPFRKAGVVAESVVARWDWRRGRPG